MDALRSKGKEGKNGNRTTRPSASQIFEIWPFSVAVMDT